MIRSAFVSASFAFSLALWTSISMAQDEPSTPQALPQVTIRITPLSSGDYVLSWQPGSISCEGGSINASEWADPNPSFIASKKQAFPVTLGFAIDAGGRAVDITALEGGYVPTKLEASFDSKQGTLDISAENLRLGQSTRDLMPSLRASKFLAGSPKSGCSVTYTPQFNDAANLSRQDLAVIGAVPGVRLTPAQLDQLGGSDCNSARWPNLVNRAYPDWRRISARDGARRWSWVSFGIDEGGVPIDAAVIASSGGEDLDREALRAVSQSRFADGARTGCVTWFWRDPKPIAAPNPTDLNNFKDYQSCSSADSWARSPKRRYPQAYQERAIEGWAVISFDVAADGTIENSKILAAQPTEEFGKAGMAALQTGRFKQGDVTRTQCIERIVFAQNRVTDEVVP
jgi:TonB family protein